MTETYSARDHFDIGYAALHRNQLEEAVAQFEKVLALDAGAYEAMNHLGMIALGKGEQDKAVEWWMKSIDTLENSDAHYNLGFYYAQQNATAQAKQHLERVIELNPLQRDAIIQLAHLEIQGGNFTKVEALMQPLVNHEVAAEQAHLLLSQTKYLQKDTEEAKKILSNFLEKHPHALEAMHQLCRLHVVTGSFKEAEEQFDILLQHVPHNLDLIKEYGRILYEHLNAEKSVLVLLSAMTMASADWQLQLLLGTAQEKAGLHEDAISSYNNALSLNPGLTYLAPKIQELKAEIT